MKFRNGHNDAQNFERSMACTVFCHPDEDMAVQSDRDDADINVIIRRYNATGIAPRPGSVPYFADVVDGFDLHVAMQVTREAQESFDLLPSDVRSRFSNNPNFLAEFLGNPDNRYEAAKLGLLRPEVAREVLSPAPAPVPVVPATPAGGSSSAATG